jgi:deferrochelatase/peroxidase EfeB
MTAAHPAEADDIQALLWSGFNALPAATFLLLRIQDRTAARAWLREAPVTTIGHLNTHQATALQIALSANGLTRLGVAETVVGGFAPEFLSGMATDEARSRRLGDVGANAPANWRWGGQGEPDVLLLLYAEAAKLEASAAEIAAAVEHNGFEIIGKLATSDMGGKEPFGFVDGVSQPQIDWSGKRKPGTNADLDYGNLMVRGEFLLGYQNEYGQYTDRPLLPDAASAALPHAEDQPGLRDLGRNGSYLVLRELHQDVRGFWRFMAARANAGRAEALAEHMIGRQLSGDPLLPLQTAPIRGVGRDAADTARNQFTYDADPEGVRCPLGAHVRRANPRTADMPGGQQGLIARLIRTLGIGRPDLQADLMASSRFHRILRRGREFGTWVPPDTAMQPDCPDPKSGLQFLCLNANISRQFEFVQNAWLSSTKFNGMAGESDPVTGNRLPLRSGRATDGFSLPQPNGAARRLKTVPAFVTVHGGGYFFLPGVRALRFLAQDN